jgi:hypothetical protein
MFSKNFTNLVLILALLPLTMGAPAATSTTKPCVKRSPIATVSPAAPSGYRNAAYFVNW